MNIYYYQYVNGEKLWFVSKTTNRRNFLIHGPCVVMPQQVFDFSDEETICQLAFNAQWHYALNITEDSYAAKYLNHKTLWKIRSIAVNHGLDTSSFERTSEKLRTIFDFDTKKQRIDFAHIKSTFVLLWS